MHLTYDKRLYNEGVGKNTLTRLGGLKLPKDLLTEVYLVTMPLFGDGLLEIYDARELAQKYYKTKVPNIHVVGVAPSKEEAFDVVQQIITDVMKETGGTDLEGYFIG